MCIRDSYYSSFHYFQTLSNSNSLFSSYYYFLYNYFLGEFIGLFIDYVQKLNYDFNSSNQLGACNNIYYSLFLAIGDYEFDDIFDPFSYYNFNYSSNSLILSYNSIINSQYYYLVYSRMYSYFDFSQSISIELSV
eukprot:TRINITY_DN8599_c0_g2_i1.p2 TRINITY_DN8599_c0_g2~~TRINITY_DN8599_c0_g2_i1.p2  ORF type:complete len:135 (+),score=7.62 TRINITY_DN8599_c0_g2_i1:118-522(+)